jgi:hypothetical protein
MTDQEKEMAATIAMLDREKAKLNELLVRYENRIAGMEKLLARNGIKESE